MIDLKCRNEKCKRHLGEAETIVGEIICPGCKGSTQFKIITADQSKMITYKFAKPERPPKSKAIGRDDAAALMPEVS